MRKILKLFSKLLPENNIKDRIRFIKNNFLTKNKFKVYKKKEILQFRFDNGVNIKCFITTRTGGLIEEARIITEGYLKHYKIKRGDIVLDCGSHIGMFSLFASQKAGPSGKVIALEPDARNYKQLKDNIKLNNATNIIALKKGTWDKETQLSFEGSLGAVSTISKKEGRERISVSTIDNIIKRFGKGKTNFIKMDIEGAEIESLMGAKNTLKNNSVNLAIASYHISNGENTSKKIEEILNSIKYNAFTTFPDHLTTFAKPKDIR